MKKLISIFLLISLTILAGCSSNNKNSQGDDSGSSRASGSVSGSDSAKSSSGETSSGVKTVPAGKDDPVAAVQDEEGRYGYINVDGEWVIAPQYDTAYPFSNGVATVQVDSREGTWQIIDKSSKVVATFDKGVSVCPIPASYNYLEPLVYTISDDRIIITKDDPNTGFDQKYGFADTNGEIVLEPEYTELKAFREGYAAVNFGTPAEPSWGYVNKQGSTTIAPKYDAAGMFSDGLAYVENSEADITTGMSSGYVDTTGNMVVHAKFVSQQYGPGYSLGFLIYESDFYNGYAFANVQWDEFGTGFGIIDKTGSILFYDSELMYTADRISPVGEGLFCVDGKPDSNGDCAQGFMDMTGAVVIPVQMQWKCHTRFSEGLCAVVMRGAGGLYGYIDKTGAMKIEAEYIFAKDFSCGLAAVSENGNDWFYIDKNGMPITNIGYRSVGNPFTK